MIVAVLILADHHQAIERCVGALAGKDNRQIVPRQLSAEGGGLTDQFTRAAEPSRQDGDHIRIIAADVKMIVIDPRIIGRDEFRNSAGEMNTRSADETFDQCQLAAFLGDRQHAWE